MLAALRPFPLHHTGPAPSIFPNNGPVASVLLMPCTILSRTMLLHLGTSVIVRLLQKRDIAYLIQG